MRLIEFEKSDLFCLERDIKKYLKNIPTNNIKRDKATYLGRYIEYIQYLTEQKSLTNKLNDFYKNVNVTWFQSQNFSVM